MEGLISEHTADSGYGVFEKQIASRIESRTAYSLFRTDVSKELLWQLYITSLPENVRQTYNCHACRHFIERFGGLVTIDALGFQNPLIWSPSADSPAIFAEAENRLFHVVRTASVSGAFCPSDREWGAPRLGGWTHLHGTATVTFFDGPAKEAEVRENYIMLTRAVHDYDERAAAEAVRVLEAYVLSRSEKVLGIALWFRDLHKLLRGAVKPYRKNVLWAAAALAPTGYAHVRSSMIGTLLDDILAGHGFEEVSARWNKKMHPSRYQRPTAPPKEGAIDRAEKLVAELGIANSLRRRFATQMDVLSPLWIPTREVEKTEKVDGEVFAILRERKPVSQMELPTKSITWVRFKETVLPTALEIDVLAPMRGAFYGLLAAVDPEAPPILQWDGLEGLDRNTASHYIYTRNSNASQWGLGSGGWRPLTMVFEGPWTWQRPELFKHHPNLAFFAIQGAMDTDLKTAALFPEMLRSELREVRSVIEAYSNRTKAEGEGNVNGLMLQKDHTSGVTLRVRSAAGVASHFVDRWE